MQPVQHGTAQLAIRDQPLGGFIRGGFPFGALFIAGSNRFQSLLLYRLERFAVLFAAFLVWAIMAFRAARRREPTSRTDSRSSATITTVVVGLMAYGLFAVFLHPWLIGVPVM